MALRSTEIGHEAVFAGASGLRAQSHSHRLTQRGKRMLDHAPDRCMVDPGIAVNQQVAKSRDLREMRDVGSKIRARLRQLVERLADHLELALDGGMNQL